MYQLKRSIQSTPLTVHFITSPSTLTRIPLRVGSTIHSLHTARPSPADPTVKNESSDNSANVNNTTVPYTLKELIRGGMRNDTY